MSRVFLFAVLCFLGLFAVSAVTVDTELPAFSASSEMSPALLEGLAGVHAAVAAAESFLDKKVEAQQAAEFAEGETAFLEAGVSVDSESETEAEEDMEQSLGLDAEHAEDALFVELEQLLASESEMEMDAEMELDAEMEAEMEGEADAESEAEVDQESALDSEAGSVTVPAAQADQLQAQEPIVTEQMETQQALDALGLLEAGSEAEAEMEAETEAETEAEAEALAEAEAAADAAMDAELDAELDAADLQAEVGEEQTAITKCGKKITWERKEEPNPEQA